MEIIFKGHLLDCILMGCCSLKQEKNIKFHLNLNIYEYSNLFSIGIVYNENEIINSHLKKFIFISDKYSLLGKKEGKYYKTIFTYEEIRKNLLHLPREILDKIFSKELKSIIKVNKYLYDTYIEEYNSKNIFSFEDIPTGKKVKKLMIRDYINGKIYNHLDIEELYLIERNIKLYSIDPEFIMEMKNLKTLCIFFKLKHLTKEICIREMNFLKSILTNVKKLEKLYIYTEHSNINEYSNYNYQFFHLMGEYPELNINNKELTDNLLEYRNNLTYLRIFSKDDYLINCQIIEANPINFPKQRHIKHLIFTNLTDDFYDKYIRINCDILEFVNCDGISVNYIQDYDQDTNTYFFYIKPKTFIYGEYQSFIFHTKMKVDTLISYAKSQKEIISIAKNFEYKNIIHKDNYKNYFKIFKNLSL